MVAAEKVLCVAFSSGGTADVGRHAVRAGLDAFEGKLLIVTNQAESLEESNWNSGCPPHSFTEQERKRMEILSLDFADKKKQKDNVNLLSNYFTKYDVNGIVSALGNRQPFFGDRVGASGTQQLADAIIANQKQQDENNKMRWVAITSVGCNEDWPPMEFHWAGNILKWMFRTICRSGYRDLSQVENIIRGNNDKNAKESSSLFNYLLVRPTGLGEERRPKGEWKIQQEKYKDKVGPDMCKMDCARFAVQEVLEPTYKETAVVIGSDWDTFQFTEPPLEEEVTKQ